MIYKDWTLTTPAKSYEPWKTIAAGRAPPLNVLEKKITYDVYVQYVIDIKPWSRFIDDLYRLNLTLQLKSCTFCCFARTRNRVEVQIKSQNTSDLSKINQPSAYWEYIIRWIIHYTLYSTYFQKLAENFWDTFWCTKKTVTKFQPKILDVRWQNWSMIHSVNCNLCNHIPGNSHDSLAAVSRGSA